MDTIEAAVPPKPNALALADRHGGARSTSRREYSGPDQDGDQEGKRHCKRNETTEQNA